MSSIKKLGFMPSYIIFQNLISNLLFVINYYNFLINFSERLNFLALPIIDTY